MPSDENCNYEIPYKIIINHLYEKNCLRSPLLEQIAACYTFICLQFQIREEEIPEDAKNELTRKLSSFLSNLENRYKKASYHIERILRISWSESSFNLPFKFIEIHKK